MPMAVATAARGVFPASNLEIGTPDKCRFLRRDSLTHLIQRAAEGGRHGQQPTPDDVSNFRQFAPKCNSLLRQNVKKSNFYKVLTIRPNSIQMPDSRFVNSPGIP